MSYYTALSLREEPFSTSPDPDFFYESAEHREAMLRLEIAIKLRRGCSVILGDVGTGKTTLARRLFNSFSDTSKYEFNMILDPTSENDSQFLSSLMSVFDIRPEGESNIQGVKKALERYLFQKAVDEDKTVILLIDEAQKLSAQSIEVLRTLLNYETNKFKLLQLVLFAQMELLPQIREIKNFWDRIALKYVLNPLNEEETSAMIAFRMKHAGYGRELPVFTEQAVRAIHAYTQGCPRRITLICHNALEFLVMRGREQVDLDIIHDLIAEDMGVVNARA